MNNLVVEAGDVVVTQFGLYQHWSVASDRLCSLGKNMLISATKRTGTVQEEPWDDVTQGKHTYVAVSDTEKSIVQILSDARSQIGTWKYSLTDNNCEHFVKWSSGLKVSSSQIKAGVGGLAIGGVAVVALAENPRAMKIVGGAVLLGGIAVMLAKAVEKKRETSV
ncbi:H-REV 107-related protein [Moritella sp. PE36]|uniref:lecithin retinol acyltransferase family protein n=1 Tax=Moritella sp. PE36 TaxID=58051 RepID=UPI0001568B88|nr:lecithin retinol acyltransferase family protein [Moritella sp. PE36]EDM65064.1 H-REV 107-related protein [Moritella sp. PE36]